MKIEQLSHKLESAYSWAIIPEDLPKANLFYVTAKTASPAIHPEDPEDPIRQFSLPELHEAARSLGRRFINMNHDQRRNIESAFTVDAQYNPTTQAVEALIYVPDQVRDMILRGEIKRPSVEYVWRDIRKTEVGGSEFIGIIFDKIALLEESWLQANGFNAGDSLGEIRKCESTTEKRGFLDGDLHKLEADIAVINENKELIPLPKAELTPDGKLEFNKVSKEEIKEIPPEQGMKQDQISEGLKTPEQGFPVKKECDVQAEIGGDEFDLLAEDVKLEYSKMYDAHKGEPFAGYKDFDACVAANKDKSNPQAYCGYIKHKAESVVVDGFTEAAATLITAANTVAQTPEGTNVMPIAPDGPVLNQTPVSNEKPKTNVASAGMVEDKDGGVMFGKPEETNPHKNLDMPKAPSNVEPAAKLEGTSLSDSTPIKTSNEINVIGMDESKQKVEAVVAPEAPKEPEKKPVDPKPVDPKPADPIIPPVVVPLVEDYKAKFEAVAVELKTTKEHEAFLEGSCKKLSDNAKEFDTKLANEVAAAKKAGKQEVIQKFKEVIPDDSQFGYNIQNSTRSLITTLKKKCFEMSREE